MVFQIVSNYIWCLIAPPEDLEAPLYLEELPGSNPNLEIKNVWNQYILSLLNLIFLLLVSTEICQKPAIYGYSIEMLYWEFWKTTIALMKYRWPCLLGGFF